MHIQRSAPIPREQAGQRLDRVVARLFPDYSRSRLQTWIRAGQVQVDGRSMRPRDRVRGGEEVVIDASLESETPWQGESLPLEVVHGDDAILVIHKPAGLVVHPAAGNRSGTLVNALLHYAPELERVPRAGLVHRLDKDTSGLLVVARTIEAHTRLVGQLKERAFLREYQALVTGALVSGGRVDAAIGRHPVDRKRMAVVPRGRPAVTHYRVQQRFAHHTLLGVRLETGRTHQIRVHMTHIRHPLVGDPVYGGRPRLPKDAPAELVDALRGFGRQALHAARLGLRHPVSGDWMEWRAPVPEDFDALLAVMAAYDVDV